MATATQTPAAGKFTKEEGEVIKRALTAYERMTGDEKAAGLAGRIQIADPEKDAAEEAKRVQDQYNRQAELARRVEETQQAQRQAERAAQGGDDTQPGNPGGGQEALATERAKAAGARPASPPSAAPHK